MGTTHTYQNHNPLKQIQQQYKIIKIDQSGIAYIQERSTSKEYILKQFTTNSLNEFQNLGKIILKKKNNPHQHILQIKQTQSRTEMNFCSNVYKIFMIIQYPFRNLFQQIQQRKEKKYEWFTENQLWSILYSCSLGIRHLYSTGSKHQLLCSSRIYIEKDGIIKIGDPYLLDYSQRYATKNIEDHFYPPPEELKDTKLKNDESSDIFTLGMILMEAINLQCMQQIYEANMTAINFKKLKDKISKIANRYSKKLQSIIRRMLIINETQRILIKEIEQIIQNQNFQETEQKQSTKSTKQQKKQTSHKRRQSSNLKTYEAQIQLQPPRSQISHDLKTYASPNNYPQIANFSNSSEFSNYKNLVNNSSPYTKFKSTYQPYTSTYLNNNNQFQSYAPHPSLNLYNNNYNTTSIYNNNSQLYTSPQLLNTLNYSRPQQNIRMNSYVPRVDITYNNITHYNANKQTMNQNLYSNINNWIPKQINNKNNEQIFSNESILKEIQLNKELNKHNLNIQNKQIKASSQINSISNISITKSNTQQNKQKQINDINPIIQNLPNSIIPEVNQSELSNNQTQQCKYVTQIYDYGSKYEGYQLNGMRHGFGKFYYQDGGYYEGQWKFNKMNGYAKLYYQNGQIAYEGNWLDDQFHGKGKVFNDNPKQLQKGFNYQDFSQLQDYWIYYSGDFLNDGKHGYGSIKLSNGEIFEGRFEQDVIKGQGRFYCINGEVIQGIWQDSKLIKILNKQQ